MQNVGVACLEGRADVSVQSVKSLNLDLAHTAHLICLRMLQYNSSIHLYPYWKLV